MGNPQIPVVNAGLLYVNGLALSAGALNADLLSTSSLIISAGQCRDSTDENDILLTNANVPAATINVAVNGANGLDVGALAASTMYSVYVIGDSSKYQPTAGLLSTNANAPTLPFGYDMFRRIGTVLSNAAGTRILNFIQRGNGSGRDFWYAVPLATALTAGASATFASFNWATATPFNVVPISAPKVFAKVALTADAGGTRTVVFSADGGTTIAAAATAGEVIMSSPASTVTSASLIIPCEASAGPVLPMVSAYAVSNASASVAVSVQGFVDLL